MSVRHFGPATAAAVLALALGSTPIGAQTVGTRITVGTNPVALAVNPVTNKIYVANADSNNVTVINVNTGGKTTIPVSANPRWVAINPELNTIYVSSLVGANTAIIDGATDTILAAPLSGGGGWTAINPLNDRAYVLRYGGGDEVNIFDGETYTLTAAFRSYQPVAIAVNPVNNWTYIANAATGDISAVDLTTAMTYPPLKCPDGSGGFRAQPPDPPAPYSLACIDIPNVPTSVAVNPVTNKIYALSTSQISVISGTNHTYTTLSPAGTLGTPRTIAVNPVTNRIYAVFSRAVVVIDGTDNSMTVLPVGSVSGGAVAVGVNVLTNMIYVPSSDGTMLVIDGLAGTTNTISITAGANAVTVNPITNMIYVLDSAGGVTPVSGATGTANATGITTSITPLAGNTSAASGSITLNASSSITPAPLNMVRRVYFRIGSSGPWTAATGTGPYTASYSGLSQGSHTIQAFATNSLEAPSINTDLASVPVVGNVASYTFFVSDPNAPPPADVGISMASNVNPGGTGKDVVFTLTATNAGPGGATGVSVVDTLPAGWAFIWASPGCTHTSGTVTCNLGSLSAGGSTAVKVVARPAVAGSVTNGATINATEDDPAPGNNTAVSGVTVNTSPTGVPVLRYRLYSPVTLEHHFTTDLNEYNVLGAQGGWVQEGTVGKVLNNPGSFNGVTAVPYYRLYNDFNHWHHWTTDANEYYTLLTFPGWNGEGVDGYILPTNTTGAMQLYRLVYPNGTGLHHWTVDSNEYTDLINLYGWVGEGGAGFVVQ